MPPVVIENPTLNSPAERAEPTRHFRFTDEGITNEIDQVRRISQYFAPFHSHGKWVYLHKPIDQTGQSLRL